MASINHNRVSVVIFRLVTAALLLFTASYPQAEAQFLGGLIPGLGIPLPLLPNLGGLIPGLGGILPLPNIPLPPVSLPSIPPLIPSLPVPPVSVPPPPVPSQLPAGLNVTGQLCCTPNGNCPVQGGGQGVGGVPVILNCTFRTGTITVGGGNTGVTGTFSIISFLPVVLDFLSSFFSTGGQLPCVTIIDQLALSSVACPALSNLNATLVSLVTFIGTTTNALAQTIVNANVTGFFGVPV